MRKSQCWAGPFECQYRHVTGPTSVGLADTYKSKKVTASVAAFISIATYKKSHTVKLVLFFL
jgi:hypothetical protein